MNMRKINLLVIGIITILFTNCKKEETEKSSYTYDGIKYLLTYGSIQKGDTNTLHSPNTYNFKFVLGDKNISYDETTKKHTGTGNYIFFNLISSDGTNINEGSFVFDGFASGDSLTFDKGLIGINHDIAENTTGEVRNFKTGIINLRRNGNIYIIDFELYTPGDPTDKVVKGFYKGFLFDLAFVPE